MPMFVKPHVLWHDWMRFSIVCERCHRRLLFSQWSGGGGEEWPQIKKAECRLEARHGVQRAERCESCGRPFATARRPVRSMGVDELLARYRRGQRRFSKLVLVGDDLSTVALDGARMFEANLSGSRLVGTGLRSAVLTGASLVGADFAAARLQRADLSGAELVGANLSGTDLQGAKLIGGDLRGASLYWANLEGAQLRGALLDDASLRGARLRGAILPDGRLLD
ncbi:pentapeptide repeat-containing protein [Gloeobacter morelensis MG652769]|uniref:Pentapeptide repeat-containing protein n=2 Tax=Gloeobacter TaxID=33071 RepID=A0ABY3PNH8_9CYAN|nr:pentapeptide repeat-containing protein [Gloeobacter morelensis MG652769]